MQYNDDNTCKEKLLDIHEDARSHHDGGINYNEDHKYVKWNFFFFYLIQSKTGKNFLLLQGITTRRSFNLNIRED